MGGWQEMLHTILPMADSRGGMQPRRLYGVTCGLHRCREDVCHTG
jgi:hypothetical protein